MSLILFFSKMLIHGFSGFYFNGKSAKKEELERLNSPTPLLHREIKSIILPGELPQRGKHLRKFHTLCKLPG